MGAFFCSWPIHFNVGINLQLNCSFIDILNTLIALGGIIFAIYQFAHQNKENRKITIDQNNKNWYLSVLVIPNLDRINQFFDEVVSTLKDICGKTGNNDLVLRAKEQYNAKDKVIAFFTPLEAALSSYDATIRQGLFDLGLSLQDEVTNIIEEKCIDPTEIEKRIMNYKGQLIGILYQPIKGQEKNTKTEP